MTQRIDLHLHTTCSDGLRTPSEILEEVRSRKLAAFAITDHDTIDGFLETGELLKEGDPELIAGLELSCSAEKGDLHLLAYLFDPDNARLLEALNDFQEKRNQRGRTMVQRLNDMGITITYDDVLQAAGSAPIGRPHVAEAMHRRKAVATYDDAFRQYIGDRKPAYVPKANFTPAEAIDLIHAAGGVAVLAHPMVGGAVDRIEELVALGIDGIEALHPDHKQHQVANLKEIAARFRLIWTGGSDFHGRGGRCGSVGSEAVPIDCLQQLRLRSSQKRGSD
ncbi:MAG: PHP domain-containing protein [candidate division Zixibacteria bacterium]|nr:PHP domain-containing protein [candidate division Zixibacteria bacterium]MDH3938879.1 PHP domain-containing protein [candidate division Zixibacteria bacterium]MDH4033255.1 PHP domain-containing protein [candidate division Zixibacteria bacterium]